ncbi:MAG: imidazole glycerol phosphate synthase subunit HisH [Firmicutes bacterium]|nr:imidazole glycerol phosphate synthase subunit HisH [Bacillota bacterium]
MSLGAGAIAIVDYGMGNLRSVQKALEKMGRAAVVTADPDVIAEAPAIVLPGVGAFALAMDNLRRFGQLDALLHAVDAGRPLLGICLGMQLLFEESEETVGYRGPGGSLPKGLGLLPGRVRRFPPGEKVPQMGWNRLNILRPQPLFGGVEQGAYVYFLHSYYVEPASSEIVAAAAEYGIPFAAAVQRGSIFGIQFHPEKSSAVGLRILDNFGRLAAREGAPAC